jgi:hypothetical protein
MMPKAKPLTFDPARLTRLAKARDAKRALSRSLSDQYQLERERLLDARRRAELTRANAATNNLARAAGEEAAAKIEAEADAIRARMAELQKEIDMTTSEATAANQLVTSCLAFASAEGLTIPAGLSGSVSANAMGGA